MSNLLSSLRSLISSHNAHGTHEHSVAPQPQPNGSPRAPVTGATLDSDELDCKVIDDIVQDAARKPSMAPREALQRPVHASPTTEAASSAGWLERLGKSKLAHKPRTELLELLRPLSLAQLRSSACDFIMKANPQIYAETLFSKLLEGQTSAEPAQRQRMIDLFLDWKVGDLSPEDRVKCLGHIRSLKGTVSMRAGDVPEDGTPANTTEVKLEGLNTSKTLRFAIGALLQEAGTLLHDPGSQYVSAMLPAVRRSKAQKASELIQEASRLFAAHQVEAVVWGMTPKKCRDLSESLCESLRANGELTIPTGYAYRKEDQTTGGHATYDYLRVVDDKVEIYRTNLGAGSDVHERQGGFRIKLIGVCMSSAWRGA